MKVLTFFVNNKKYGIGIDKIKTIEKNDRVITSIPNSKISIRGVVNVRSQIVPIIDLRYYLDNELSEFNTNQKSIICEENDKLGAILVDETEVIIDISENDIEDFTTSDFTTSVVNLENNIFMLINLENILEAI